MSVKSSARIKKRRSAEAAAATASPSSGSFAAISSQRGAVGGSSVANNNSSNSNGNGNASSGASGSNSNANQNLSKKHNFVGRNPNFDTDETKLLIQLWGDPKLQRTLITTHKKHAVICQLAAKMQEYGYHRSPEEITTRIKNLKCFYNRLKKDKEYGMSGDTEPSWKHFAEMDAIMTRPIFSVRPNEVPAPSLKYQLEQALEEHAERRKRRQENGEELSESENEEDDILLSSLVPNGTNVSKSKPDDNEGDVQVEVDPGDVSPKRRKLTSEKDVEDDEAATLETRIKTEPVCQPESTPAPELSTAAATTTAIPAAAAAVAPDPEEDDDCMLLPLPKEEPIDVDAVEEPVPASPKIASTGNVVTPTRPVMPTLTDMLQLPKNTNLLPYSGANVIIPANSISTSVSQLTSTTASSSASSGKLTPGKISLVPTNFLMQPKQASNATAAGKAVSAATGTQLQLLQSAINQGARLMISGSAPTPVQATPSSGLVTGPGGVKFVLVNAEQAAAAKAVAAVGKPTAAGITTAALPQQTQQQKLHQQQTEYLTQQQLQQTQQQQQQQVQQLQQSQQQQQQQVQQQQQQQNQQFEKKEEKRRAQEMLREEQQSKRHMTTMRIMLRQLLNAQNEANEIQHNRLSLERERLDWEKSMGERLLTMLPTLLQPTVATAAAAAAAAAGVAQPGPTHQSPQFIVSSPAAAAAAAASAAQRLQPPKLLFTTALPMSNGTVSMPHILNPNSALATSLPKVIGAPVTASAASGNAAGTAASNASKTVDICTDINEVQLVTPKLEKDC
ncbi:PREDICTED: AF4/FMR2 family member 4 [Drosophila arizonae]|uniref:AF4/FMR2 family member 4 n=1 Tax=Drosophila arizonae TaxID=7263 RepID=A0ABM1PI20_DROAR|nr:PREDICTED: AF4/FMR2 family member 4 [Drosophila arizonae]XP_017866857.1 PREDICTED: AF4/FMR2 family member 4 [Drosophila arizonae]